MMCVAGDHRCFEGGGCVSRADSMGAHGATTSPFGGRTLPLGVEEGRRASSTRFPRHPERRTSVLGLVVQASAPVSFSKHQAVLDEMGEGGRIVWGKRWRTRLLHPFPPGRLRCPTYPPLR